MSVHREGVDPNSMDGVPDLHDHNSINFRHVSPSHLQTCFDYCHQASKQALGWGAQSWVLTNNFQVISKQKLFFLFIITQERVF